MATFVEVHTHLLNPPALDWAVAKALGKEPKLYVISAVELCVNVGGITFNPSTSWSKGGPLLADLIDTGKWEVVQGSHPGEVILQNYTNECNPVDHVSWCDESWRLSGSLLVAACRAITSSALGSITVVPKELLEATCSIRN